MSSLANKTLDRTLDIGRWLIMAGIAYTLVSTAYYFIAGPTQNSAAGSASQVQQTNSGAELPRVGWETIAEANLFGTLSKAAPKPVEQVVEEVSRETKLPLTLLGLFRADEQKESAAIVAEKGKPGKRYAVGEKMPGNAKLVEVHADHIVLRRAGVLEALHFPKTESFISANPNDEPEEEEVRPVAQRPVTRTPTPKTLTEAADQPVAAPADTQQAAVDEFRDQLKKDPAAALDKLGVEAVSDSGAEGYKLGALANSPFLRNTGLRPGDVLLSVNGEPVGNAGADQLQLNSLLAQGSARMEIQRGKRRFFVTASLR